MVRPIMCGVRMNEMVFIARIISNIKRKRSYDKGILV